MQQLRVQDWRMKSVMLVRCLVLVSIVVLLGFEGFFFKPHKFLQYIRTDPTGPLRDVVVVLIWKPPFGYDIGGESCMKHFNISGCRLTKNRSEYESADAVMFHHRDIQHNVSVLRNMSRPAWQKWVWMNMESPSNSARAPGMDGLFNLTATYRRDSDIWVPYGHFTQASDRVRKFQIPRKDKLVCWVVSHWNEHLKRVPYFKELSKHVDVKTYGAYFQRALNVTEYFQTLSSCKFYLAFENSVHRDYITEKLFNPLLLGTVPVVFGPPRDNYEEFLPTGSFIHVEDFRSPRELARHLMFLDRNPDAYGRYFAWRKNFDVVRSHFPVEHACRICDHLKQQKGFRVVKNLSAWYWS